MVSQGTLCTSALSGRSQTWCKVSDERAGARGCTDRGNGPWSLHSIPLGDEPSSQRSTRSGLSQRGVSLPGPQPRPCLPLLRWWGPVPAVPALSGCFYAVVSAPSPARDLMLDS